MIAGHVFIATSLDGFIARHDGDIEWLLRRDDPTEDHGYNAFIKNMDGIIMGRGSFEKVRSFDPWPYSIPVVVLSKTMTISDVPKELSDKVQISNLAPIEIMDHLANLGWKNVYVDGGQVIQSFLRDQLIEDMVVTQVPVLIGEGKSLFGPLAKDISLKHSKTIAFPSGLVQSHYRVIRE